ncbi:VOC family protein [Leisingera sp. ANG59]|uniref:VOC family protein n=1 Tax=Leisingera sp. ANG59 TaxID=2675221 RepID=UPI0020C5B6DA|nr:VOC family protein [Leisingera sp. ANG59]
MKKKPAIRPRGFRTCTTSLAVVDVPAALAFYNAAFDAEICARDADEDTRFASIKIGNSMMFVTQGWQVSGHVPTQAGAAAPVAQHMYVADADTVVAVAVKAGARLVSDLQDTYWGERSATLHDPFGHIWTIATRLEQLSAEELEQRRAAHQGLVPAEAGDELETEAAD